MHISDENLRGRTVIGSDGKAIGEVAGLSLDDETWSLEALQVKLRKPVAEQIGAAHSMFHPGSIEIPKRLIQSIGDAVVLSIPVEALRASVSEGGEYPASPQP